MTRSNPDGGSIGQVKWARVGGRLTLTQGSSMVVVRIIILVFGIPMASICLIGIFGLLASGRTAPSNALLGLFIMFLTGLILIYAGAVGYWIAKKETIVFDNGRECADLHINNKSGMPYSIPYADILRLCINMEGRYSGEDSYNASVIYLMKTDGAEIWLAEFHEDHKKQSALAGLIAAHAGLGLKDLTGKGTDTPATNSYAKKPGRTDIPHSSSVVQSATASGQTVSIRPAGLTLVGGVMAVFGMAVFLAIPLFIPLNFFKADTGLPIKIFAGAIMAIWYIGLALLMFLGLREYRITVWGGGLTVECRLKLLPRVKSALTIPADRIRYVRANRGEEGVCYLSLGIDGGFMNKTARPGFLLRLGAFGKNRLAQKLLPGEEQITLWEVRPTGKGKPGPDMLDLVWIENFLQENLRLKEKDLT